ncbi:MAG: hypothetical protein GY850_20735 [bacterium]|nr:hypothetical protein [bacterium]
MIYRMLISTLMFTLKPSMKVAAWRSRAFRAQLQQANFTIQMKIYNKTYYYLLQQGRWRSSRKMDITPDLLIEWKNAQSALRCLLHRDVANIINSHAAALTDGRLSLEFDIAAIYRFSLILNQMTAALTGARVKNEM